MRGYGGARGCARVGGAERGEAVGRRHGRGAAGVFLVVSLYRHRQIRRLAEEIDEVLHSGRTVDFSNCREGDVAVLANELSKMVSRLSRTRDQLARERNALADSLADVSHQIRTPLTAITLMLPVVERADDARERKRAVRERSR